MAGYGSFKCGHKFHFEGKFLDWFVLHRFLMSISFLGFKKVHKENAQINGAGFHNALTVRIVNVKLAWDPWNQDVTADTNIYIQMN